MKNETTAKFTLTVTWSEEDSVESIIATIIAEDETGKRCTLAGDINTITPRDIGNMVATVVKNSFSSKSVANDSKKPEKEEAPVKEKSLEDIHQEFEELFEQLFSDDDNDEEEEEDEEIDVDARYQEALEALQTLKNLEMLRLLKKLTSYIEDDEDDD